MNKCLMNVDILQLEDVALVGSSKSQEFAQELTKRSIRFSLQNGIVESVCATEDEPAWVLNFKKGIISSLQNSMNNLEENEVRMI